MKLPIQRLEAKLGSIRRQSMLHQRRLAELTAAADVCRARIAELEAQHIALQAEIHDRREKP
jgi:hypothetical protein